MASIISILLEARKGKKHRILSLNCFITINNECKKIVYMPYAILKLLHIMVIRIA